MVLLDSLFTVSDIIKGPLCFVLLLMVFSVVVRKYKDEKMRKLFLKAFYFKMFFALAYTFTNSFYYRGGDTVMYFHATNYLHNAFNDDVGNFTKIYMTKMINVKTTLVNYFMYTGSEYPVFEAMHDPGNFMVPKFALPVSLVFDRSYLCIAMFFSFFALAGSIRLFKVFYHYYPDYWREIAFATLFLPSVAFWSSGVLKDSLCFGAVGFIVHGVFNLAIKRHKIAASLFWVLAGGVLLFFVKVYILLALAPAIVLWLFGEFNKVVENKTLRRIMGFMTFAIGIGLAFLMINYATSEESLQQFQFDAIAETSASQRELYESFSETNEGAYYSIKTSNPVLLVINGIVATLFRPFIWEVNGITALLSSLESLLFLFLTGSLMYKRGVINFFRNAFKDPVLLMCFVFSLVFAAAIGSTALNFGSLSRYKIPCLPFYLAMVFVLYRQAGLKYPKWLGNLLGYKTKYRRVKQAF
jgi:hypothetical protein